MKNNTAFRIATFIGIQRIGKYINFKTHSHANLGIGKNPSL